MTKEELFIVRRFERLLKVRSKLTINTLKLCVKVFKVDVEQVRTVSAARYLFKVIDKQRRIDDWCNM